MIVKCLLDVRGQGTLDSHLSFHSFPSPLHEKRIGPADHRNNEHQGKGKTLVHDKAHDQDSQDQKKASDADDEESLTFELGPPYDFGCGGGPGGWVIVDEPEISFGENIFVPAMAGWKKKRLPVEEPHNWISVAPDWVCEILSPTTVQVDRVEKMPIYAQHHVLHVWLIDPIVRTLELFRLESGRWVLLGVYAKSARVHAEPFPEIELDLGLLSLE